MQNYETLVFQIIKTHRKYTKQHTNLDLKKDSKTFVTALKNMVMMVIIVVEEMVQTV